MIEKILVVSNDSEAIKSLTSGAAQFGCEVALVYGGCREAAVNADKAIYLGDLQGVSYAQLAPAVAKLAAELQPDLVLADTSRDGRLVSAAIAVALDCAVVSDVLSVKAADGAAITERMVYGGGAVKTEKLTKGVVCCGPAVFEPSGDAAVPVSEQALEAAAGITLKEVRAKEVVSTNLAAAKKVVVLGRGIGDETGLEAAQQLAAKLGAELGCTRPVSEEAKLLPKERYIGVSGVVVKPDVLLSLGASGQIQHTVGTNQAGTIIAVNTDKNAPIFDNCDYGLIGDCKAVIQALMERVK